MAGIGNDDGEPDEHHREEDGVQADGEPGDVLVAWPVSEALAILRTGAYSVAV